MEKYSNVNEYIAAAPEHTKNLLQLMRETIKRVVPAETVERISYGIPTFTFRGNLVHFAGYENHIGFYPGAAPIEAFKKYLEDYKTSKGTIQFPLDKPLPVDLIQDIVKVCVERNLLKKK